jgi:hypothetical protein
MRMTCAQNNSPTRMKLLEKKNTTVSSTDLSSGIPRRKAKKMGTLGITVKMKWEGCGRKRSVSNRRYPRNGGTSVT